MTSPIRPAQGHRARPRHGRSIVGSRCVSTIRTPSNSDACARELRIRQVRVERLVEARALADEQVRPARQLDECRRPLRVARIRDHLAIELHAYAQAGCLRGVLDAERRDEHGPERHLTPVLELDEADRHARGDRLARARIQGIRACRARAPRSPAVPRSTSGSVRGPVVGRVRAAGRGAHRRGHRAGATRRRGRCLTSRRRVAAARPEPMRRSRSGTGGRRRARENTSGSALQTRRRRRSR